MAAVGDHYPAIATDDERTHLRALDRLLESARGQAAVIVIAERDRIDLPEVVRHLLHDIVHSLARGEAVTIASQREELTTQQAADLLNVSRPYLVRLLEEGQIPFAKVGTHRRIRLTDLLDYKVRRDAERRGHMDRLVTLSEELGLYAEEREDGLDAPTCGGA